MSSSSFLNSCHTQYYVVLKQIFTTNNIKIVTFHYKNCVSTMFCFNGSQQAKMKKSIPDMSLPINL